MIPRSWGKRKGIGGHPQTLGKDDSLHPLRISGLQIAQINESLCPSERLVSWFCGTPATGQPSLARNTEKVPLALATSRPSLVISDSRAATLLPLLMILVSQTRVPDLTALK